MDAHVKRNLNIIIDTVTYAEFIFLASTGLLMRYTLPAGSGHYTTVWGLDRHEWGALHFWISIIFLATIALHLILHWKWIIAMIRGRKTESSGFRFGLGLFGLIALLILAFTPLISPVERTIHPGQQRRLQQNQEVQYVTTDKGITGKEEQSGSMQQLRRKESGSQQILRAEQPDLQQTYTNEQTVLQQAPLEEQPNEPVGSGHEYSFGEVSVRGYMTLSEISEEYGIPVSHILEKLGLPENTSKNETFGRLRKIYGFEMHDVRKIVMEYREN